MKKRDAGWALGAAQEPVNLKRYQIILTVIGLIVAMGIVGQSDYDEAQRQAEQYCEMVKLWKQTNGQAGWPAYDGEEVCRASSAERARTAALTGGASRRPG